MPSIPVSVSSVTLSHLCRGLYLSDLTFIEDGNADMLDAMRLNFEKHVMVYRVIADLRVYQSRQYQLQPVPEIQEFLNLEGLSLLDEKQAYAHSLVCEPRDRSTYS